MGRLAMVLLALSFGSVAFSADRFITVNSSDRPSGEFEIYVNNRSASDITISFELDLVNMRVTGGLKPAYVVPKGRHIQVIAGRKIRNAEWKYSYTYNYRWGNPRSRLDSDFTYLIPLESGSSARILQGYGGSFSHKGGERFSVDWDVPEGTGVYAARGGVVVQVIEEFSKAGRSIEFKNKGNVVIIAHPDGSVGNYVHFKKDGVVVEPGQKVRGGDLLGYSGNTGYSTQPHLHFDVSYPVDGMSRQTIPVVFRAARGILAELKEGERYTAVR